MRTRYTFRLRGHITLDHVHPIVHDQWTYEFLVTSGQLTAIQITVPFPEGTPLASVKPPSAEKPAAFEFEEPLLAEVVAAARTFVGLLTLYDPVDVDTENPNVEWLPESEAEAKQLSVFASGGPQPLPPVPFRAQFRALAQCVVASRDSADLELFLSFYRRGELAIRQHRFIEAIYMLFFALECQFGEGKWRTDALVEQLCQASVLTSCIEDLLSQPESILRSIPKEWAHSPQGVLRHYVELRGDLHHHGGSGSRAAWHPESNYPYQMECAGLAEVVVTVAIKLASGSMFSEQTLRAAKALCPH